MKRHIYTSILLALLALLFSFYLMFHTVSYDSKKHSVTIAMKTWSDFGAHIPLIRSFSTGNNFNRLFSIKPVESPLFPNEPIRYHFGFYAIAGLLERLGMRLDYAVNIPSALGFFLMLVMIFIFSYSLFAKYSVSVLSVLFTLFNGSLSFLSFFKAHPLSFATPTDILTNTKFASFGPWDGGLVSAFWTLNIYTNQRHLALSYALVLLILTIFARSHPTKGVGTIWKLFIVLNTLLVINYPSFTIAALFLCWFFITQKKMRLPIFLSAILTLPALYILFRATNLPSSIAFQRGYLIQGPINIFSFIAYWFHNIGFHIIMIPLGILLSPKSVRRLLIPPLFLLFLIPNVFRLSPDMINNHKFFNFFMIIGGMFSAYAVIKISHIRHIGRISLICLILLLTLSGVIDLFPIINDTRGIIADTEKQQDIQFFTTHTSPNDIIANSTWFYHPASLAGRAIFSGYTYFTWSYGYDQGKREHILTSLYRANTIQTACDIMSINTIAFVELSQTPEEYLQPNLIFWNTLPADYTNPHTQLRVYSKNTICNDIQK